jgi:hypothetical protein
MVKIENAFKWVVVAVLVTAIAVAGVFNYSRVKQAEADDPVGVCIRDRLLEAQELRRRGWEEKDAGREDAGDRLLNQAFALENSMVPCMDDFND